MENLNLNDTVFKGILSTEIQYHKIKVKKLSENAIIPTQGSEYAAGWDLYGANTEDIIINPHETIKIPTDLAMEIPEGTFGGIFPRSGLATKQGLRPANCTGVIDSDYRGNVIVAIHNDTDIPQIVTPKERIAQLIVIPYFVFRFEETNELSDTVRGAGGFGSTGTN